MRPTTAVLLITGMLVACGQSDRLIGIELDLRGLPPTEVVLSPGQAADIDELHLAFQRVLSDSRCPVDVQCLHAGDASIELGVGPSRAAGPIPMYRVVLHTGTEPRSAVTWGARVTLLELTPEPTAGGSLPLSSYRARVRVVGIDVQ